jgi:hypothetical protein
MGEERNAYKLLVGKPKKETSNGRPRCRWKENNKLDIKENLSDCGLDKSGSR